MDTEISMAAGIKERLEKKNVGIKLWKVGGGGMERNYE